MRFRTKTPPDGGIAMAPLIDVVFLLLIFFLVSTVTKSPPKDVETLELPTMEQTQQVKKEELDFLVISIESDGAFYVDGVPSNRTEMREVLARHSRENPDDRIRLDADRNAPIRAVAEVLDLIRVYNLPNFGIKAHQED